MPYPDARTALAPAILTITAPSPTVSTSPTASFSQQSALRIQQILAPNSDQSLSGSQPHWLAQWFRPVGIYLSLMATILSSCKRPPESPISLKLHQQWHLQPGQTIANYPISSGLGDIVIALGGKAIYMPKAGRVQRLADSPQPGLAIDRAGKKSSQCVTVTSPEIPAYRLRLCHLRQLQLGYQPAGKIIGRGEQVAIAMLRKQPEGTWAFVEPSPSLLEALLTQP